MWANFLQHLPNLEDFRSEGMLGSAPTAGLYLLCRGGAVVYIGQSANLRARFAGHRREGRKEFDEALFYPLNDECARLKTEAILILASMPEYNRAINLGLRPDHVWEIRWRQKK